MFPTRSPWNRRWFVSSGSNFPRLYSAEEISFCKALYGDTGVDLMGSPYYWPAAIPGLTVAGSGEEWRVGAGHSSASGRRGSACGTLPWEERIRINRMRFRRRSRARKLRRELWKQEI